MRYFFILFAIAGLLINPSAAEACTGITLKSKDGTTIVARTIEWGGSNLNSQYVVVPRGYTERSYTPNGVDGMTFTARYGYVGLAVEQKEFIAEGLNEVGLSRKWLDEHHLERVPLFCVDKYGRETAKQDYKYNMTLEELYNMTFDFAVEDSPAAFEHVIHFDNCRTAVFDRPWNSRAELPNDRFVRCKDWQEIDRVFEIEKTENDL